MLEKVWQKTYDQLNADADTCWNSYLNLCEQQGMDSPAAQSALEQYAGVVKNIQQHIAQGKILKVPAAETADDPINSPDAGKRRVQNVIKKMIAGEDLTEEEKDTANSNPETVSEATAVLSNNKDGNATIDEERVRRENDLKVQGDINKAFDAISGNTSDVKIPDTGSGNKTSLNTNDEEGDEEVEDEEPPTQPSAQGDNNNNNNNNNKGTSNKLWNAYKSGELDGYPTLKAVADIISNNARMNMDRAALLTGGQRDLDAYKPIETETDKVRDKQVDERAKLGGYTLNDAIKAAKNGDYSLLQNAIGQDLITVENAAMSLNMSPETLNKQFSTSEKKIENEGKLSDLEVKSKELGLTVEQFNSEQAVQTRIDAVNDKIKSCNEAITALNGNAWDAYTEAFNALSAPIKGVQVKGNAASVTKDEHSGAKFNFEIMGQGLGFDAGNKVEGNAATSTSQTDVLLEKNLDELQKKAQEAMEGKNEANNELIKYYESLKSGYEKEKKELEKQLKALRKKNGTTEKSYDGSTPPATTTAPATTPTDNGEGGKAE